jgi:uncharacterized protein
MIVIDANLLLYAYDEVDPRHPVASRWFINLMDGADDVGLALVTILAFLRISTNPRIYEQPRSAPSALEIVGSWLARPNVRILEPTGRHWSTLTEVIERGRARGSHIMDAHLAALTIEHGATLATADRGFARFAGLRTIDPTAA